MPGERNDSLFRFALQQARRCDDFDALLDVVASRNATLLAPLFGVNEERPVSRELFGDETRAIRWRRSGLSERVRPLLQVEDIRAATGGETALLDSHDLGFFTVDTPNFWDRPEMSGCLRDVRLKPDKYAHHYRKFLT